MTHSQEKPEVMCTERVQTEDTLNTSEETTTSDWEERAGVWARTLWRQRDYESEYDAENAFIDFVREERTLAKKEFADELRGKIERLREGKYDSHRAIGHAHALEKVLALLLEQES